MKIYIKGMGPQFQQHVITKYVPPTSPLIANQLKEQQESIQSLESIVSILFDTEYIDVHGLETSFEVWEKLELIYGGDKHVQKDKEESLRWKFDDMRMVEGENITQYGQRIKEVVGRIKSVGGTIDKDTMVSKILRTLLSAYAIRVSSIQELRSDSNDKVTVDSLIGKLVVFELNSFDNSVLEIESSFKAFISSVPVRKGKYFCHSNECRSSHHGGSKANMNDEDNLMEFKDLLAKRLHRGTCKYKGKLPLKYFSCNKIGHLAANYPNSDQKEKFRKYKGK